jgi:tetratricopeptide (TPR) repeat protein
LDKAKEEIDQAVLHDKTKGEPKAWYYKGVIYMDLLHSPKPELKSLSADPLKEAYEAFNNSQKLDVSKGEYYKLSDGKLKEMWADVINKGIEDYEAEQSKSAIVNFEMAQKIQPEDTTAYIYASYAAESLEDNEKLRKYTGELVRLNNNSAYVYRNRIFLENDPVKKIALAKQAVLLYPKDQSLNELLGDIYAEQSKNEEAYKAYKVVNDLMPGNVTILTKMALQQEKLHNQDLALDLYKRIIILDNTNFIANYNAAIIYFEKGKTENDKIHKLNMDEYHKQGKQLEEEVNKQFNVALTHANVALKNTKDEGDISNIQLMIGEIQKVLK